MVGHERRQPSRGRGSYHAQRLGLRGVIDAALHAGVKVERPRGFGAEVVLHGDTLDEARAHAWRRLARGPDLCAPYDDEAIVAGQARQPGWRCCRPCPTWTSMVIAVAAAG